MTDLINETWLYEHVLQHGKDVKLWSWHAKNEAASQALHNCENPHRLKVAMIDFFADHSLKHLYMECSLPVCKTREIVWDYLESDIVEQIERILE